MIIDRKKKAKAQVELVITLDGEELEEYFQQVYVPSAKDVEIKGFRKGKAPRALVLDALGSTQLVEKTLSLAINKSLSKALKQEKLAPIAPPAVKVQKWVFNPLSGSPDNQVLQFVASVVLMPKIKLGDYRKIKVAKNNKTPKATKREIEQIIDNMVRQKATTKVVQRVAKMGDLVEIDFSGFFKGVEQEKLTSSNHPLILGSNSFVPGFEEQLVGKKAGEGATFNIKFPANYHSKEFAGKKVQFQVKIKLVKQLDKPKLDEDFAKGFGHKDMDSLRQAIGQSIVAEKKQLQQKQFEEKVISSALKLLKVEIPQGLIEYEQDRMVDNLRSRIEKQGMSFTKYLDSIKKTAEQFRQELAPRAKRNVQVGLMLGEVAKAEKIKVTNQQSARLAMEKLISYASR